MCSHRRGVRRQRSIQSVLSARAFPHWHLCNFKLGLSGEGGTKLLFVSKQALPQLLTHSNDYLIWAFVISQLIRNIQAQRRETEYPVPEADMLATETAPVSFLPLLTLFQMHNPSLSCTHSPLLLPSLSAYKAHRSRKQ